MMSSLFIGATGVKTHSDGLNAISNNLANVNTVGFKQQSALFEDLMSQDLPMGSALGHAVNQRGMGSQTAAMRTLFTQGGFEPGSSATDLAIAGKGFFQVVDGDKTHYTRAGNFQFDVDGRMRDPAGFTLSGIQLVDGQEQPGLVPVHIDPNNPLIAKNPSKTTTALTGVLNIGSNDDNTESIDNPFFSLLQNWNGAADPKAGQENLPNGSYSYSQPMKVYDSTGAAHNVTVYFDGAPSTAGQRTVEFMVAANPKDMVGPDGAPTAGTGPLMSGTLTFSSAGQLLDMSAFTPTGGDPKDLANWKPAPLVNGVPQFTAAFAGAAPQAMTLDLGIKSANGAWGALPVGSAAEVGLDPTKLISMGTVERAASSTSNFSGASNMKNFKQDGYVEGDLADVEITESGMVRARYTNSQTVDLFKIPICRFTSEDGLRREGNNHYSAPEEAGGMEYGTAGTSNYGKINSRSLETSNVDMAREMSSLIIMQRGFQMNSKTITTADTMLQKALEIKK